MLYFFTAVVCEKDYTSKTISDDCAVEANSPDNALDAVERYIRKKFATPNTSHIYVQCQPAEKDADGIFIWSGIGYYKTFQY